MRTKSTNQSRRARVKARRTLVPVDFSDSSARALRHAAQRAAESGGSLIIVHVVPADYGWLGIGRDELRDVDRSLQRQAADRLRSFVDENVGDDAGCGAWKCVSGHPAEEIRCGGDENQNAIRSCFRRAVSPDLIGISLAALLIGSHASRPCPVIFHPSCENVVPITRKRMSPAVLRFKHESKGRC